MGKAPAGGEAACGAILSWDLPNEYLSSPPTLPEAHAGVHLGVHNPRTTRSLPVTLGNGKGQRVSNLLISLPSPSSLKILGLSRGVWVRIPPPAPMNSSGHGWRGGKTPSGSQLRVRCDEPPNSAVPRWERSDGLHALAFRRASLRCVPAPRALRRARYA